MNETQKMLYASARQYAWVAHIIMQLQEGNSFSFPVCDRLFVVPYEEVQVVRAALVLVGAIK